MLTSAIENDALYEISSTVLPSKSTHKIQVNNFGTTDHAKGHKFTTSATPFLYPTATKKTDQIPLTCKDQNVLCDDWYAAGYCYIPEMSFQARIAT